MVCIFLTIYTNFINYAVYEITEYYTTFTFYHKNPLKKSQLYANVSYHESTTAKVRDYLIICNIKLQCMC